MKRVNYQRDQPDEFYHRYSYDADNRITQVRTSADGNHWHTDARYFYSCPERRRRDAHGPLQRVELGAHKVQGIDYAYTLQGWLKGINSNLLAPTVDMGRDGDLTDADPSNDLIGRDAYGLSLGYYGAEDYKAIGPQWTNIDGRPFAPIGPGGTLSDEHRPLYNGNIAHTVNTLQPFGLWNSGNGAQGQVLAQVYRYDQLNRLKQARGVEGLTTNNRWQTVTDAETDRYRSTYTYDANGNITAAERWDRDGNQYDDFSYKYAERSGKLHSNRLYQLNDLADAGNLLVNEANGAKDIAYTGDVPFASEAANINGAYNYSYDQLGNLIKDDREGIANIQWTVAGKVKQVEKTDGTVLTFAYGADGQRLWKEVTPPVLDDTGYREYYIRDAQGNIMATYRSQLITVPSPEPQGYAASLRVTERPVYGSSRLGTYARWEELYDHPVVSTPAPDPVQPVDLNYELTDHLGNVTAVVTGRLLNGNGGGTPKQAELVSAQGYEAFGSLLPGRNYSSDSYRWGFNGAEKDDEMHGTTGTSYDFGARMQDPRVGRWLSLDPLGAKYPAISPYAFALNSPLLFMDPNGKEGVVTIQRDPNGGGQIIISTIVYVTGAGATQGKVDDFNSGYKRYAQPGTYTDASGQTFDVNINITFQYAPDRSAIALQRGENILELTEENIRSHATGVGGEVRSLDPKTGEWSVHTVEPELGQLARLGKNDHNAETATHEVLHLLGLSDRYKDMPLYGRNDQGERVQTATVSVGNPGFQDDIMGTGVGFSPVHTENYGNYILGQESSKGSQFILDRFVDLDGSGNLIGGEPTKKP